MDEGPGPLIFLSGVRHSLAQPSAAWVKYLAEIFAPYAEKRTIRLFYDEIVNLNPPAGEEAAPPELNACDVYTPVISTGWASSSYARSQLQRIRERGARVAVRPIYVEGGAKLPDDTWPINPPLNDLPADQRDAAAQRIVREIVEYAIEFVKTKSQPRREEAQRRGRRPNVIDLDNLTQARRDWPESRYQEVANIDTAFADGSTCVLSIMGPNGSGKTALCRKWITHLQVDGFPQVDAILAWSFDHPHTSEFRDPEVAFQEWAFDRLGLPKGSTSTLPEAQILAREIAQRRVILILDAVDIGRTEPDLTAANRIVPTFLQSFALIPRPDNLAFVIVTNVRPVEYLRRLGSVREIDIETKTPPPSTEAGRPVGPQPPAAPAPLQLGNMAGFSADRVDPKVDPLGIKPDVDAIAELICLEDAKPPLSVALFGQWGSGKTTFMEQLLLKVRDLTTPTNKPGRKHNGKSLRFVENVVQIRFNAWHYADSNLWASLTAEFFDQLRAGGVERKSDANYATLVDRVARHVRTLEADAERKSRSASDLEHQRLTAVEAAAQARSKINIAGREPLAREAGKTLSAAFQQNHDKLSELGRRLGTEGLASDVETFAATAREALDAVGRIKLASRLFWNSSLIIKLLLIAGGLTFLALVLSLFGTQPLGPTFDGLKTLFGLPILAAAIGTCVKAYILAKPLLDGAAAYSTALAKQNKELAVELVAHEAKASLLAEKAEAARHEAEYSAVELKRYTGSDAVRAPASVLRYLLQDIDETKSYEQNLGIVSLARRSFEKLDEIIRREHAKDESNQKDGDGQGTAQPTAVLVDDQTVDKIPVPERIVLYIDDLDRCDYNKVYDVLQAVHLLLALQSFVVIVGVDVRWIEEAIKNQIAADPLEYLEKIFQIPFWLRPISSKNTYQTFVDHLLAANKPRPSAPPQPTPGAATGNGKNDGEPPRGKPPAPLPPPKDPTIAILDRPAPAPPPAPGAGSETAVDTDEEAPALVTLSQNEFTFLQAPEIGTIVGKSPRAVKRFINIYRIVRARRRGKELARFIGDGPGPPIYPAAVFLLAIDIGQKPSATLAFRKFVAESKAKDFAEAIAPLPSSAAERNDLLYQTFAIPNLGPAVDHLLAHPASALAMSEWQTLSDEIRRYSFNNPQEIN